MPFNAADFTAGGSMIWTVEAQDVVTYAYLRYGTMMVLAFNISGTATSGTASTEVRIALPSNVSVMRQMSNLIRLNSGVGLAKVFPANNYARITFLDFVTTFPAGVSVEGEIVFEIQ